MNVSETNTTYLTSPGFHHLSNGINDIPDRIMDMRNLEIIHFSGSKL